MGGGVIWKPKALRQFKEIQQYIKVTFGKATLDKFLDDLFEVTERLRENQEIERPTAVRGVGRAKVYKKTNLFYRIQKGNVVIHRVSDQRQDPQKNPYLRKR